MSAEDTDIPSTFDPAEAVQAGLAAPDRNSLYDSSFYLQHGPTFEDWAKRIRAGEAAETKPSVDPDRLRFVHWNVEQGKAWEAIVAAIENDHRLRDADLWTLNEIDIGMARSGNRNVARDLANQLGLHWVSVPNYFEMTKGPGPDALAPGENEVGLHGSALFSRWPLVNPGSADLPECFDYFDFPEEKRYGCRRLLWATVKHPKGVFTLATTHLEVRASPTCRARQLEAALSALPEGDCLFAGDFNSHTFRRGGLLNVMREFLRLQRTRPEEIDRQLIEAWEREPLFDLLERNRFSYRKWNDASPTVREVLSGVDELSLLPRPVRKWMVKRFSLSGRVLRMRLDWIVARGPWMPAADKVWTGHDLGPEGLRASDHAPIGVEAVWSQGSQI